ncbi:histidine kinase [Pontibacter ummariensis]|uniref:Histidine kinase n=1 Tax=Pontibacter ummariensis TaxID=1610492 RepID=A0A239LXC8_9BACT|nr:sensor histidine kinase [Pontibacter ummariensis]PRY00363.1 histidine kinase [Pontibacter ummariensis]SNT34463.1 Histidine kinase [Pontibacter ummariensis]
MKPFWQRHLILLLHLSFWVAYLSFNLFNVSRYNDTVETLYLTGVVLATHLVICYFNYFLLLPRLMRERRLLPYLLRLLPVFTVLLVIRLLVEKELYSSIVTDMPYIINTARVVQVAIGMLFILAFITLLKFTTEWLVLEGERRELENQQLAVELKYLRAQINPHFLFNTLNSLYYLSYTKSDYAPEVIDRLSQMMRYMIYDANQKVVPLQSEIKHMRNYIELEQMRLNQQVKIDFEVHGPTAEIQVAPFLFMTFLENAFKHGVNPNGMGDWVQAKLSVGNSQCRYVLRNSKGMPSQNEFSVSSGVGLQNVQRRLELSYPDRHRLKLTDGQDFYEVDLTLTIA